MQCYKKRPALKKEEDVRGKKSSIYAYSSKHKIFRPVPISVGLALYSILIGKRLKLALVM